MLKELLERYPSLAECRDDLVKVKDMWIDCYKNGGKLLLCGNGGSCADAKHIVGELMKGFLKMRPLSETQKAEMRANNPNISEEALSSLQNGLPAIALPDFTVLNSAFCNDVDPSLIYAQPLMGLGNKNDIVVCISTSGNSKNACAAAEVAKALGITVVGLTGKTGGKLKDIADICVCVPETETFKIQELHLPVYHYLCASTEEYFFCE